MDIMPFGRAQSFRSIRNLLNVIPDMCICAEERQLGRGRLWPAHMGLLKAESVWILGNLA